MTDIKQCSPFQQPEERALLEILRGSLPGWDGLDISLLWEYAVRQHVSAFVASRLLHQADITCDQQIIRYIQAARYSALSRNLCILAWQDTIRRAFEQEGIKWIALKGPVFTMRYYGDITQRISSDLDLLVLPVDAVRADAVLRDIFKLSSKPLRIRSLPFDLSPHHQKYVIPEAKLLLELHWLHDDSRYRILSTEVAFQRMQHVFLEGNCYPVFSPEDTLLHYSMHGFVHRWGHLSHLMNVQCILKNETGKLDWDYILRAAGQARKVRPLLLALSLSRFLFHVQLPAHVEKIIAEEGRLPGLVGTACSNFAINPPAKRHFQELYFCFQGLESTHDRFFIFIEALHKLLRGRLTKEIT